MKKKIITLLIYNSHAEKKIIITVENKSNKETRAVRDYKEIKYQRKGNSIKRKQDK